MNRTPRTLLALVILLAVGLVFYFLWHSSLEQEIEALQVGLLPITDAAQVFIAQETGLFSENELTVAFVPMRGGAATLPALGSGSVDVAFTNLLSAALYDQNIAPLTPLAGGALLNSEYSESGLLVATGSNITKLGDLKGRNIAVNVKHNILHLALQRALRKAALVPGQYEITEVPFPQMEGALRAGRVDAIVAPEPFLSAALASDGLINLGDIYVYAFGEIHLVGYFTTTALYEQNQDTYQRFNASVKAATPIANDYDSTALNAIHQHTGVDISVLRAAGRPRFVESIPEDALEQMLVWMREEDFLDL